MHVWDGKPVRNAQSAKRLGCKVMLAVLQDAEAASAARWLWGVANAPPSSVTADPEMTWHHSRVSELWREREKKTVLSVKKEYIILRVEEFGKNSKLYFLVFVINLEKRTISSLLDIQFLCIWQMCIFSFLVLLLPLLHFLPHLLLNLLHQHCYLLFLLFNSEANSKCRVAG